MKRGRPFIPEAERARRAKVYPAWAKQIVESARRQKNVPSLREIDRLITLKLVEMGREAAVPKELHDGRMWGFWMAGQCAPNSNTFIQVTAAASALDWLGRGAERSARQDRIWLRTGCDIQEDVAEATRERMLVSFPLWAEEIQAKSGLPESELEEALLCGYGDGRMWRSWVARERTPSAEQMYEVMDAAKSLGWISPFVFLQSYDEAEGLELEPWVEEMPEWHSLLFSFVVLAAATARLNGYQRNRFLLDAEKIVASATEYAWQQDEESLLREVWPRLAENSSTALKIQWDEVGKARFTAEQEALSGVWDPAGADDERV